MTYAGASLALCGWWGIGWLFVVVVVVVVVAYLTTPRGISCHSICTQLSNRTRGVPSMWLSLVRAVRQSVTCARQKSGLAV